MSDTDDCGETPEATGPRTFPSKDANVADRCPRYWPDVCTKRVGNSGVGLGGSALSAQMAENGQLILYGALLGEPPAAYIRRFIMFFQSHGSVQKFARPSARPRAHPRLRVEILEDRSVPSTAYLATDLVS